MSKGFPLGTLSTDTTVDVVIVLHREMFKGVLTNDFQLQVLSMNQFPLRPLSIPTEAISNVDKKSRIYLQRGEPVRTTGEKPWHSV